MITEDELYIYTDGSSIPKPRRGGIGYRIIIPDYKKGAEECLDYNEGSFIQATNNQMELLACIKALKKCYDLQGVEKVRKIFLSTDSKYVENNVNFARFYWPTKGWTTSTGEPVSNIDLWKDLVKVLATLRSSKIDVHFCWVKGKKDVHTKKVDNLAKEGASSPIKIPFNYIDVRRKKSPNQTIKGSVNLKGQRLLIRVIGCERIKEKKLYRIRYEVMSKGSENYQNLDFIYHIERLFEGHTYLVSLKRRNEFPQISKVIEEIET